MAEQLIQVADSFAAMPVRFEASEADPADTERLPMVVVNSV